MRTEVDTDIQAVRQEVRRRLMFRRDAILVDRSDIADIDVSHATVRHRRVTMDAENEILTVEELANALKVDPRTIQRIVHRKEIPAIRVGRQWRFRREWVDEWINKNTVNQEKKSA
jgi:excisionase family DNA binding protein